MIRPYETAVVIDGTLSDDVIAQEQAALEEFFKTNAEFEGVDVWGKRALAYTIKKKKTGYYVIFNYRGEGTVPAAFEKHIRLDDSVLRHLTVVRDLKNDAAREAWAARREKGEVIKGEDDDIELDQDRTLEDRYQGGSLEDRYRDRTLEDKYRDNTLAGGYQGAPAVAGGYQDVPAVADGGYQEQEQEQGQE